MLEFLKECGTNELAMRAKDCEINLKSFNPVTPMVSLIETSLKSAYYTYYPEKKFDKTIDVTLNYMLGEEKFIEDYGKDYHFVTKNFNIVDSMRRRSNAYKHEERPNSIPTEDEVKNYFKCLYFFCSGIYKTKTGKAAPSWDDEAYEKLVSEALTDDKRGELIDKLNAEIEELIAKAKSENEEKEKAQREAENLRNEIETVRFKNADKAELESLKAAYNSLQNELAKEKENSKETQRQLIAAKREKDSFERESKRIAQELKNADADYTERLENEKAQLELSYSVVCEQIDALESKNNRLQEQIRAYIQKTSRLTEQLNKLSENSADANEVKELKKRLAQLESKIAASEAKNKSLQQELDNNFGELSKIETPYSKDSSEFQQMAVKSAELYYRYLADIGEKTSAGYAGESVSRISMASELKNNCFWLHVKSKIYNVEALRIEVDGLPYPPEDIKPTIFDSEELKLRIEVNNQELAQKFIGIDPERVKILSDMKFLVARVGKWYKNFGNNLHLPTSASHIPEADYSLLSDEPTSDQVDAVKGILNNPFTYVWGAPGTGKTQFVLSRAVLSYLQAGKKVLVTAPTNNAVEQTLYGLLKVLAQAGVDYNEEVVRFGTASESFARQYPGVCEDSELNRVLDNAKDSLKSVKEQIEENNKCISLLDDYSKFCEEKAAIIAFTKYLAEYKEEVLPVCQLINGKDEYVLAREETIRVSESNIELFNQEKQKCTERVAVLRKKLDKKGLGTLLGINNTDKINSELLEKLKKIQEYEELEKLTASEIDKAKQEIDIAEDEYKKNCKQFDDRKQDLARQSSGYKDILNLVGQIYPLSCEETLASVEKLVDEHSDILAEHEDDYSPVVGKDAGYFTKQLEKLQKSEAALEARIAALANRVPQKSTVNCKVFACTLDNCISRFIPCDEKSNYAHVFLDEAAYAPLIKAATLFSYGCPVTFLGDHMQLPPVCEVDEDLLAMGNELAPASLWAQSALHAEDIFYDSPETVVSNYTNGVKVKNRCMVQYDLVNSHRFGDKLARVLAGTVYSEAFRGNPKKNTDLFYIDAKYRPGPERRQNPSECLAIREYLKKGNAAGCGVITPYKGQVKLLKNELGRSFNKNDILNVHRSQGREWDTVILSVSDTDNKFFTNTATLMGKQTINTAVSRAKDKLILVCDYTYWAKQPEKQQLITGLLKAAERIPVDIPYNEISSVIPSGPQKVIPKGIDPKRLYKARTLKVARSSSGYAVSGGAADHIVIRDNSKYVCDCQDYKDGTQYCKHVLAVMIDNKEIE